MKPVNTGANLAQLGFVGERIGYLLRRADVMHMQLIRDELSQIGLTPARATALAFIHENPGCRQNALGKAMNINRASTMEVVNALVALGAVERRDAADRRANALFVTSAGEALVTQFIAISREVDDVITETLSPADRATLIDLFARMTASLGAALDESGIPVAKGKLFAIR